MKENMSKQSDFCLSSLIACNPMQKCRLHLISVPEHALDQRARLALSEDYQLPARLLSEI
jgi:hypothetical protein